MKQPFAPYRHLSLDQYRPTNESQTVAVSHIKDYIDHLEDNRLHGKGLTLVGPNGTGKTMLGNIVLNAAQEKDYRVEAIEMATYVGLHKDLFRVHSMIAKNEDDLIDTFIRLRQHIRFIQGHLTKSADWVLFDDVGREFPSESGWSQNELFDTLRFRYNRGLPFLLTTNWRMAELERQYTEGLSSFLLEATQIILVEGDDYRRWNEAS